MSRASAAWSALGILVFTAGWMSGCSSSSTNGAVSSKADASKDVCIPGASVACVGAGGCSGGQACDQSGAGYGACVCASADGGGKRMDSGSSDASGREGGSAETGVREGGSADAGSPEGGACSAPSTANPGTFLASGVESTPVDGAAKLSGDLEAPCSRTDFDFAYFHTSSVAGNQLGQILGLLVTLATESASSSGVCPDGVTASFTQGGIDQGLQGGTLGLGMTLTSRDPTYQSDLCAGLHVQAVRGQPSAGSGTSTPFGGSIASGQFTSLTPAAGDVEMSLAIALTPDAATVTLPLHAVQITFSASTHGVLHGQINGALTGSDVQTILAPAIATLASTASGVSASTAATFEGLLDTGNGGTSACATAAALAACTAGSRPCLNADNSCSYSGDGQVGVCEVLCSASLGGLLAPDIEIFAPGTTTYGPVPGATANLDSLSVGIGFTAKTGSF